ADSVCSAAQQYQCPSPAAEGGQEPQRAGSSSPALDEAAWPWAGADIEEDDPDIIPPSPEEEELPPFSPSAQSASVFRDSPTGGRCTPGSSEARQEKVPSAHPGDANAGDSGEAVPVAPRLLAVMEAICELVDAIPLQELQALRCARALLQHRDLR
ncbi:hypothetical protein EK904_006736, partial [Melospiza melodia maxima]